MAVTRLILALALAALLAACAAQPNSRPAAATTAAPAATLTPAPTDVSAAAPTPPPTSVVAAPVVIGPDPPASPSPQGATPAPSPAVAAPGAATPALATAAAPSTDPPAATEPPAAPAAPSPTVAPAAPPASPTPAGSVIVLPGVSGPAAEPEATVVPDGATTLRIGDHTLNAQIVASPETRARGLMFYRELPEDAAMLFVFPADSTHSFWMRNTYVPLSVAFLDSERRVLNIEDLQPLDEQPRFAAAPARYAIEANQGWFAARGIGPGAVVEFELPPGLVVQ